MLYRRFALVVFLISLMGVGMANLVVYSKQHRDIVMDYPGMRGLQIENCNADLGCALSAGKRRAGT